MTSLHSTTKRATGRGFTIVELLIVIVVIAILASISVVAYNGIQDRASDARKRSEITYLQKILEMYHIDNGGYPTCSGVVYQPGQPFVAGLHSCGTDDSDFVNALVSYTTSVPGKLDADDPFGAYNYTVGAKKASDTSFTMPLSDSYIITSLLKSENDYNSLLYGNSH